MRQPDSLARFEEISHWSARASHDGKGAAALADEVFRRRPFFTPPEQQQIELQRPGILLEVTPRTDTVLLMNHVRFFLTFPCCFHTCELLSSFALLCFWFNRAWGGHIGLVLAARRSPFILPPHNHVLETFLAGALSREFRDFMRILMTFRGKTHRDPS